MNIKGKFVCLRAMELEDQKLLIRMINDPDIEKMVGGYSFPISKEQQINWFKLNGNSNKELRLIIETEKYGAVGLVNMVDIDWKNRNAFIGIKISDNKLRSKGIGTDAMMAIMKYAFEELQLNRLETTIIEYNLASINLYTKKCGWKQEGIKRNSVFKCNKYNNEIIISILKEEYLELIKNNRYWEISE